MAKYTYGKNIYIYRIYGKTFQLSSFTYFYNKIEISIHCICYK